MQGVYNYVGLPETKHFSRVYNFADILYLQFMLLIYVMLYPMLYLLYFILVLSEVYMQQPI
jgi:hypothetical protein